MEVDGEQQNAVCIAPTTLAFRSTMGHICVAGVDGWKRGLTGGTGAATDGLDVELRSSWTSRGDWASGWEGVGIGAHDGHDGEGEGLGEEHSGGFGRVLRGVFCRC